MQPIRLSIAIVTRNRPESLKQTLFSISQQNVQPFEIIVSDDSDQVNFQKWNKKICEKYHCLYFKGPQKGLYANRNFVAKKCSGTHFRTMDDDHEFPENHLGECVKAIEREPDTIWTLGEYYPKDKYRPLPSPIPGQLHPRGFSVIPKSMDEYYGISCGGSIYPARVVEEGIFNCDYYKFGNLFLEYGARLKKLGYTIKFITNTYIIHNATETSASQLSRETINEARLFSMFCFSFYYKPTVKNKLYTFGQLAYDLVRLRCKVANIKSAYKNYKNFQLE